MKNREGFIRGIFTGMLILCFFMAFFPKETKCTVTIGHGNANVEYITYGIIKGEK